MTRALTFSAVFCLTGCASILGADFERSHQAAADDAGAAVPSSEQEEQDFGAPEPPNPDGSCASGKKRCGELCVSVSDPAYGCSASSCTPCSLRYATPTCKSGACAIKSCAAARGDCDGKASNGCETDLSSTPAHCGACGNACSGSDVCGPAGCASTCPGTLTTCGKSCVDTASNAAHCGACDAACADPQDGTATCTQSKCTTSCNVGFAPCAQGCCANVAPSGARLVGSRHHTCLVVGAGSVKCWGYDGEGQLGGGTTTPATARPTDVTGLSSIVALAAGGDHTCAISASKSLSCWGRNFAGQLGDGTTTNRDAPVTVALSNVVAVAGGGDHTCAVTSTGSVSCWGENASGQLGDGTTTDRLTPKAVSALSSGVIGITTGGTHSCALLSSGSVKCWGANDEGQLGTGNTTNATTPVAVPGLTSVAQLQAGARHTCAVTTAGDAYCWGANESGQLGDGTTTGRLAPTAVVGLPQGAKLAVGGLHTCALLSSGAVKCWGSNDSGQLGDGGQTDRPSPGAVAGLSGALDLGAGSRHACARVASGVVCWGINDLLGGGAPATFYDLLSVGVVENCYADRRFGCVKTPRSVVGL